jgi:amino acid transporter
MMCQSASFAEAAGIFPTAGAVYDYVAAGMGRFFGITATLAAYVIIVVFAGSAEVASLGLFAQVNFDVFANMAPESTWIIGVVVILIFMGINMLGIQIYGQVELVMTAFMWVTLIIFGVIGTLSSAQSGINGFFGDSFVGTDLTAILSMVGLAIFLFVGVEYVTPLAAELKDPAWNIPRSMYIGVTMVAIAMFFYGAGIARQVANVPLDPEETVFLFDTPLAIPEFAIALFGTFGKLWLGIAVFLASAATINTFVAGVARILYGMAKDGVMPAIFAYLNPRYKTPWVGIIFTAVVPAIGAIWIGGDIDGVVTLILAAVCAWIFSYILVNISVVLLRNRRPDLHRPYKTPFYPLPQILGTLGMLITFWFISPPFLTRSQIYIPFVIMLGLCAAFALIWTYGVKRMDPWTPVEPEILIAEERGTKRG